MCNRWHMNRIGFVNFWLYDEEIFSFADGKLLLRGQNGSGKSITTQSFIPFILDGDRNPSRLDPFGSNDRKMEYYFLGENGREEATGYLFLEFKRENTEQYRTIGIGQRARRGKPMSFWGFVLLDGRRIGYDVNLYREVGTKKIPYTRQELRQVLGEDNPYTEAQREYMELVNRHIFGFPSVEQYGQFIKLLIQVRAPKLSKEFRPTKVYDILNDSLQTLSDEDLRAMVEAMEKMDDIQSRLESLRSSLKDIQIIRNEYRRYNLYMLGKKAQAYLAEKAQADDSRNDLAQKQHEQEKKGQETEQCGRKLEELQSEIRLLEEERDALHSEDLELSVEKLQKAKTEREQLDVEKRSLDASISRSREKILEYDGTVQTCEDKLGLLRQRINGALSELEQENEVLAFALHSEIQSTAETGAHRERFQEIDQQLRKLEQDIVQGKAALERLREMQKRQDAEEEALQKLLEEKREAEAQCKTAETMEYECRDGLIEAFHVCASRNRELLFSKEQLGELARKIQKYESPADWTEILELCHRNWQDKNNVLERSCLEKETEQAGVQQAIKQLRQQLTDIENMRMPEPEHKDRVEQARRVLAQENIPFLPFYEAVEFADGLSDEEKARAEGQLDAAGLLDALVIPQSEYEHAVQTLCGLSDTLICAHGTECGKRHPYFVPADTTPALRDAADNILMHMFAQKQSSAAFVLSEDGYFKNGILEGYCHAQEEASYVGAVARKRKKEQMMREKQEEIAQRQGELDLLRQELEQLGQRIDHLKREYDALPDSRDLDQAIELVRGFRQQAESLTAQAETQETTVLHIRQENKKCEQQMLLLCKPLPYIRKVEAYQEAEDAARAYRDSLRDMERIVADSEEEKTKLSYTQKLIEIEEAAVDTYYESLRQNKRKCSELDVRINSLEEYLNHPQVQEMADRLRQIKKELGAKHDQYYEYDKKLAVLKNRIESLTDEIAKLEKNAADHAAKEQKLCAYFREELALGLVMEQGEDSVSTAARKAQAGIRENDRNRSEMDITTALTNTFHAHLGTLSSYGTSIEKCFENDREDTSLLRERLRIVSVWNGKKLYLEEFYNVIKESIESTELLIRQKDRELFEGILADTLSRKLSNRIRESRRWIRDMSFLMKQMDTSMALTFSLEWTPRAAEAEEELDTRELETILARDRELLTAEDMNKVSAHFRTKIYTAKRMAEENGESVSYIDLVRDALDYRKWFSFSMYYYRNHEHRKELTNGAFNRFSGGEKAMAMYVPLFAAVNAQYNKSEYKDHPRLLALDEAFAGVDDKNISSMFALVQKLDFDYIMNSQVLWGCYETVPNLQIAELLRPANASVVTVINYRWNGHERILDDKA